MTPNQIPNEIPNQPPDEIPNHTPNEVPNEVPTKTARRGPAWLGPPRRFTHPTDPPGRPKTAARQFFNEKAGKKKTQEAMRRYFSFLTLAHIFDRWVWGPRWRPGPALGGRGQGGGLTFSGLRYDSAGPPLPMAGCARWLLRLGVWPPTALQPPTPPSDRCPAVV
jgi:hypothetical protein